VTLATQTTWFRPVNKAVQSEASNKENSQPKAANKGDECLEDCPIPALLLAFSQSVQRLAWCADAPTRMAEAEVVENPRHGKQQLTPEQLLVDFLRRVRPTVSKSCTA
jgi:hypothetical protein